MNANDPLVPNVPSTEEFESKVPKVPSLIAMKL